MLYNLILDNCDKWLGRKASEQKNGGHQECQCDSYCVIEKNYWDLILNGCVSTIWPLHWADLAWFVNNIEMKLLRWLCVCACCVTESNVLVDVGRISPFHPCEAILVVVVEHFPEFSSNTKLMKSNKKGQMKFETVTFSQSEWEGRGSSKLSIAFKSPHYYESHSNTNRIPSCACKRRVIAWICSSVRKEVTHMIRVRIPWWNDAFVAKSCRPVPFSLWSLRKLFPINQSDFQPIAEVAAR